MKSSINFIDGDQHLSLIKKIIYSILFVIEFFKEKKQNKTSKFEFKEIELRKFYNNKGISLKHFSSPGRLCSDAYFVSFIKIFKNRKTLNVLDIGCGNGNYSKYLNNFYPKKIINYVGLDKNINDNWKKFCKKKNKFYNVNFKKNNNDFFQKLKNLHGNFDLIFSTSVLEHIEYDLSLIKQISKTFKNSKNIHLVPAAISFFNYRRHGIRRYTYSNFKIIKKNVRKKISIFPLGNSLTMKNYFIFYKYYKKKEHPFEKFIMKNDKNKNFKLSDILFSKKNDYPVFYAIKF